MSTAATLGCAADVAALTRRLVTASFTMENTVRQADRDPTALTMSGLGGCTRAAAYAVAGTPPTDDAGEEDARQALLGVWIHEHLLPAMAYHLGPDALVEHPVTVHAAGLDITGTLDLYHPGSRVLWDLKTVKEWRLHGVRRAGTYSEHRVQVLGYGLGLAQQGHPVDWVCWLYLDRATGDVHIEVERFTNAAALAVVDRLDTIRFHSREPDGAPRDARGPGLSLACDRCPWLRRCWGPTAMPGEPGAQRELAATPAGVQQALALYAAAAATEAAGKSDREFAKLVLADVPPDRYGGWVLRRGKPGRTLDQAAVAERYAELGEEVPTKPTSGRIIVAPAPQDVA